MAWPVRCVTSVQISGVDEPVELRDALCTKAACQFALSLLGSLLLLGSCEHWVFLANDGIVH